MPGHLIIRADGDARIGTGHVMRCLALAAGWQSAGGTVSWLSAELTPALHDAIRSRSIDVAVLPVPAGSSADAAETLTHATSHDDGNAADWVVVDGYQFDADYQETLKAGGLRVLFFDDYGHAVRYSADLILNQNVGATPELYARRAPATRLLLGPRFALLREEFRQAAAGPPRVVPPVGRRVLVTLGGSDPDNVTGQLVVTALARLLQKGLEAVVVIGGSNPHAARLREQCAAAGPGLRVEQNSPRMAELMAGADLAVAAGGTTVWELAALGVPMILVVLARNQVELAAHAHGTGMARCLGPAGEIDPATLGAAIDGLLADPAARQAMSEAGRRCVDGRGVDRVILHLRAGMIRWRPATGEADSRLLWTWANDPVTRAVSFNSDPIPWESHVNWFATRSASPACRLWIATGPAGLVLGMLRFDLEGPRAVISINVAPECRGKGWGAAMIAAGVRALLDSVPALDAITAWIKPDNHASIRAFLAAGFSPTDAPSGLPGEPLRFELSRREAGL